MISIVMIWKSLGKYSDLGLLIIRLAIGASFVFLHGIPKLLGGPDKWAEIGKAMSHLGITFLPVFWGFMAAFTESVMAFLFAIGLLFRPSCAMLLGVMVVAGVMHLKSGDGWATASHALELAAVFLGLLFVGPGKLSLDRG